jgi:hypothetical protein
MSANWYHSKNGAPVGPVAFEHLQQLARAGQLYGTDMVWNEGMPDWVTAETVPGLMPQAGTVQPSPQYTVDSYSQPQQVPFAQAVGYASPNMTGEQRSAGFAIASLVLGILSLLGVCIFYIAPFLAIMALIFGFVAKGRARRGVAEAGAMATAGIVCAFISLGIDLVIIISVVMFAVR